MASAVLLVSVVASFVALVFVSSKASPIDGALTVFETSTASVKSRTLFGCDMFELFDDAEAMMDGQCEE